MPLINCRVELKLKWTKHWVLAVAGYNTNDNPNNIILLWKTQNYMFLSSLYQQKIIKNYQNVLVKDMKDQFIGINIKQKVTMKIQQMNIDTLLNQILLESIYCLL